MKRDTRRDRRVPFCPTLAITADWHLSHHPQHQDRWDIFEAVKQAALGQNAKVVIIAGDLLHQKTGYPGWFVSEVGRRMAEFAMSFERVWILTGNHDRQAQERSMLDVLTMHPRIRVVTEPGWVKSSVLRITRPFLCLPYGKYDLTRKLIEQGITKSGGRWLVVFHRHLSGALDGRGHTIPGGDQKFLRAVDSLGTDVLWVGGDIHSPQAVGGRPNCVYAGSPMPLDFGETHRGRILIVPDNGGDIYDATLEKLPRRWTLRLDALKGRPAGLVRHDRIRLLIQGQPAAEVERAVTLLQKAVDSPVVVEGRAHEVGLPPEPDGRQDDPAASLVRFGRSLRLSPETVAVGVELLQE